MSLSVRSILNMLLSPSFGADSYKVSRQVKSTMSRDPQDLEFQNYIFSQIFMSSNWGVLVCDGRNQDNTVLFANKKYWEIMGEGKKRKGGVSIEEALYELYKNEDYKKIINQAISSAVEQVLEFEKKSDDKTNWYHLKITPILNEAQKVDFFVCLIEDCTERKLHEVYLIQSQRLEALGQLAGGVAHDFNNLLSIIDGYARITKKEVPDSKRALDNLEKIMSSVKRGSSLTGRLLTFGRQASLSESVIDLGAFVRDQEVFLGPLLDASIELSIMSQEGLYVDCLPDDMGQILVNLVVNARDAIQKDGRIEVRVLKRRYSTNFLPFHKPQISRDMVCMTVRDNGYGMDEETKSKIFDPFFTTKDRGKGTGLGMSMIYGMVKRMKGHIHVDSTPGEGSEVSIYFPISEKHPETKKIHTDADGTAFQFEGFTILVVEDQTDLLEVITNMLEKTGIEVLAASNGNEALMVQDDYEEKIDFLLTDVVMPELNGVRLSEMFKDLRPDTHIIFMSGYPARGDLAKVDLPDGATMFAKPIEYENLCRFLGDLAMGGRISQGKRVAGSGTYSDTHWGGYD